MKSSDFHGLTAILVAANLPLDQMLRISFSRFCLAALLVALSVTTWACGDSLGIRARIPNIVDTTKVFALRDTPIRSPSAYDVLNARLSRTDLAEPFDFAFDIEEDGDAGIQPPGALNFIREAGVQIATIPFDSLLKAPEEGYVVDSAVVINDSSVFIVRSRTDRGGCRFLAALPRYGKFRVLELDRDERSVTLELLVDVNCGFRGLEPGIPTF
jgi:hypothetical protein